MGYLDIFSVAQQLYKHSLALSGMDARSSDDYIRLRTTHPTHDIWMNKIIFWDNSDQSQKFRKIIVGELEGDLIVAMLLSM